MCKQNDKHLNYYPFVIEFPQCDTKEYFIDFVLAFHKKESCEIQEILNLNTENSKVSEVLEVNRECIRKAIADSPDTTIVVRGLYEKKKVTFIFIYGFMIVTNYSQDNKAVNAMVADICNSIY